MESFDHNLENLNPPPRFTQNNPPSLIRKKSLQRRRPSFAQTPLLYTRKRFESGDFLTIPNSKITKTENDEALLLLNSRKRKNSYISECFPTKQKKTDKEEIAFKENSETTKALLESKDFIIDNFAVEKIVEKEKIDSKTTKENFQKEKEVEEIKKKSLVIKFSLKKPKKEEKSFSEDKGENIREDKSANVVFGFQKSRIKSKIYKIKTYWGKTSLLVPNVYRQVKEYEEENRCFFEFQDYSRKELMVQSNGQRFFPKEKSGVVKRKRPKRKVSSRKVSGIN